MKVCVVTSLAAAMEPRAPRHAVAARRAFPGAEVVFVDSAPYGQAISDPAILAGAGISRRTFRFAAGGGADPMLARRVLGKVCTQAARRLFRLSGAVLPALFTDRIIGLEAELADIRADVYLAHNIETLLPAWRAARRHGAALWFDCMEYYADMGDGQTAAEARAADRLQRRLLPGCGLVLASSRALADALRGEYGALGPVPAPNVPALASPRCKPAGDRLGLYWRNSVIGFGQRGLDDVLVALTMLPLRVCLAVQGRLPVDGGLALRRRIADLGLTGRVTVLPPYTPDEAVHEAARHDVGLCLERRGPRNHDLTVSNKIYDYHMAGLAVVAADLPGLRDVVQRSGGGVVFEPGSPDSLARAISALHDDPERRQRLAQQARRFAETEANLDVEMERLVAAMRAAWLAAAGPGAAPPAPSAVSARSDVLHAGQR